jgi:hypothetical protein
LFEANSRTLTLWMDFTETKHAVRSYRSLSQLRHNGVPHVRILQPHPLKLLNSMSAVSVCSNLEAKHGEI